MQKLLFKKTIFILQLFILSFACFPIITYFCHTKVLLLPREGFNPEHRFTLKYNHTNQPDLSHNNPADLIYQKGEKTS